LGAYGPWGLALALIVGLAIVWARIPPRANSLVKGVVATTADGLREVSVVSGSKVLVLLMLFGIGGLTLLFQDLNKAVEWHAQYGRLSMLQSTASDLLKYAEKNGHLPPPYIADSTGRPMHGWRVLLGRYMKEEATAKYLMDEPWDGPHNRTLPIFASYPWLIVAVTGLQTAWATDETGNVKPVGENRLSSTIILIEDESAAGNWAEPRDLPFDQARQLPAIKRASDDSGFKIRFRPPASLISGIDVAFADGQVGTISRDIPQDVWNALLTPNGPPPDFQKYLLPHHPVSERLAPLLFLTTAATILLWPPRRVKKQDE
jgi:hypothetical protein